MSSGAEILTQKTNITVETYVKNKIYTICLNKKGAKDVYVIWVKMIDLQKGLVHQNLYFAAMKKIKSYCKIKSFPKKQVKKYQRKMGKWINDKKVHTFVKYLYKLIHYINAGVIEANEFRQNRGVENDQSIRKEKEMITIIMKTFAKGTMVRPYKIHGLHYRVNVCFVAHKLVIEIDEDGHPYYKNDQIRQNLIENFGFTFIRINPDPDPDAGFDPDVEIAKIYNYINKSSVKLVVNLVEKSLK